MLRAQTSPGRALLRPLCHHAAKKHQAGGIVLIKGSHAASYHTTTGSTEKLRRDLHTSSDKKSSTISTQYGTVIASAAASTPASSSSATIPTSAPLSETAATSPSLVATSGAMPSRKPPLSLLPLSTILRTLLSTTVSSSPLLLPPSLKIMSVMAHTDTAVLNPDRNPLLRQFLKKTFYAQFCAGEDAAEVRRTVRGLKQLGFSGVMTGYAREVVLTEAQQRSLGEATSADLFEGAEAERCIREEVDPWKEGNLETLRMAQPGQDFVSVKFTGAGRQALWALKNRQPPSPHLAAAIDEICALARAKDVPLLIDAEQTAVQNGIDDWTMRYQRRYNTTPGHALIYNTYQAYLKSAPATLARHLDEAVTEGFTLGVKLVRGAYLGSDPRHIIHDTKAETDAAYDGIAASLITRRWGPVLRPQPQPQSQTQKPGGKKSDMPDFPHVSVVLGSHNLESVRKARALRAGGDAAPGTELAIGQLMGMADDVSCDLLASNRAIMERMRERARERQIECPNEKLRHQQQTEEAVTKAYKYIVWGSTKECMAYLLRRAHENKDAVSRTVAARNAMWQELIRRMKAYFSASV